MSSTPQSNRSALPALRRSADKSDWDGTRSGRGQDLGEPSAVDLGAQTSRPSWPQH
eukprot:CAMPEP_0179269024 /NCGR_PEP_ID=MMETSP0797-20121207/30745_1 /TAXON_ID=47934 /ORGANISM="Dinophysis acuminata, Strain DAEP01" /LENGTH=55 /DNA_ID=CAMNT_0020977329 /DNA_START=122 /DNA_END=287 /DNA_ORIENTATION=-